MLFYVPCRYAYIKSKFGNGENIPLIRAIVTSLTFRQCFCDKRQIKIREEVIVTI